MFTIYFWIDGQAFDADRFQSGLAAHLTGSVETRKRLRNGAVEQHSKYWKSEVRTSVSESPERELAALLSRYKAEILRANAGDGVRIVAEIVAQYDGIDDARGFPFESETVRLLAELGSNVSYQSTAPPVLWSPPKAPAMPSACRTATAMPPCPSAKHHPTLLTTADAPATGPPPISSPSPSRRWTLPLRDAAGRVLTASRSPAHDRS
jgi:hypothetical protein